MKKLKKMWDNNRILIILALVVIICFLIIVSVCFKYFFGSSKSSYGDRLESVQNITLKEENKSEIVNKLKESETVKNVEIHTQGKIVYIRVEFENVSLEKAKEIVAPTLDLIEEEVKENYDIHYTLVEEETENTKGFVIMGAKNINRTSLIWNNNSPIPESVSEE